MSDGEVVYWPGERRVPPKSRAGGQLLLVMLDPAVALLKSKTLVRNRRDA